jgi:hypothetical protein
MEYSLDSFFEMNWRYEIEPLVFFLNLSRVTIASIFNYSKFKNKLTLKQILKFQAEIDFIIESLISGPDKELLKHIDDLMTSKLINVRLKVNIDRNFQAKVTLVPKNRITELWADFIILFLGRNWQRELGRCNHCQAWFKKARNDQIYCKESCKVSACYYRNKKER